MYIKQATLEDVEIISKIHAYSWKAAYKDIIPQKYLDDLKDSYWVSAFEDWIRNNKLTTQLVFDNEIAVGCVAYGKSRDDKFPYWGEIVSIYTLPQYFGKGYGKYLMNFALSDLKKCDYNDVYLWVLKENKRAKKFYENLGFKCNNDEYTFDIMGKQLIDERYILSL